MSKTYLKCCNYLEIEDRPCDGMMTKVWPEYVCTSCRGRCGALAHPLCAMRMKKSEMAS